MASSSTRKVLSVNEECSGCFHSLLLGSGIDDRFFLQVLAQSTFSASMVGSTALIQKNDPKQRFFKDSFSMVASSTPHQKQLLRTWFTLSKASRLFFSNMSPQSWQSCLISSVDAWMARRSKSILFCEVVSAGNDTAG